MCLVKMFFVAIDLFGNTKQNPENCIKEWKQDVKVIKNIKYFTNNDDRLDLYIPIDKLGKLPVHIYIHGGGFFAGNKKYRRGIGYFIAHNSQNIVLNVEYGKSPKNTMVESVNELKHIFDFIYENKEKYNFDLDKVSIAGDSSGAYFALYLSLLSTNKELQKEFDFEPKLKINRTILNCGVYDYETVHLKEGFDKIYDQTIKATTHTSLKEVNNLPNKHLFKPLNFIDENTSEMLLCYSENDFFCEGQTQQLISILDKYEIMHKDIIAETEEYDHCFSLSWKSEKAKEFNNAYMEYLLWKN